MDIKPLFTSEAHIITYENNRINLLRGDSTITKFLYNEKKRVAMENHRKLYYHVFEEGGKRKVLISDREIKHEGLKYVHPMSISKQGYNVPRRVAFFLGLLDGRMKVKLTYGLLGDNKVIVMEPI